MKNYLPVAERIALYETSEYERYRLGRIQALIPKTFPPSSRILEIGAGLGHFTRMLLSQGCSVDIVEPDPERVTHLSREFEREPRVRIYSGLFPSCFEGAPERDLSSYDGVVALEVIEHVPFPEKFMDAIHERLRPGGSVLLSTPNRWSMESVVHLIKFVFLGQVFNAGDPTHLWLFSPMQLKRILRRAGFVVAHREAYHFGCGPSDGGKVPGLPIYFRNFRFSPKWPFKLLGFNMIWVARRKNG